MSEHTAGGAAEGGRAEAAAEGAAGGAGMKRREPEKANI
jgi:hypothetical protein